MRNVNVYVWFILNTPLKHHIRALDYVMKMKSFHQVYFLRVGEIRLITMISPALINEI